MTPETRETRHEIRLALVLNGGVSLAVWIGGVVAEIDRARRAGMAGGAASTDPVLQTYRELLALADSVVRTDVIAGASAGGLNGCLLAAAVANRGSVDDLRDTWIEIAAFREMLRSGLTPNPPSVLKGDDYFLPELNREFEHRCDSARVAARIEEAGERPPGSAPPAASGADERVELYVTGTDLIGEPVSHLDDFGGTLRDREHRGLFHFRHDIETGESSFREPGVDRRLARVARSTASFPGAFEASFCWVPSGPTVDSAEPPLADDPNLDGVATFSSSRWVIDGGVLDNAPFRPALGAIAQAPSRGSVRRVLCYVSPYGSPPDVPRAQRGQDPSLRAVVGAAFNMPRDATLTETLEDLEEHRRRVGRLQESRRAILNGIDDLRAHSEAVLHYYRSQREHGSVETLLDRLLTSAGARTSRASARSTTRPRAFVAEILDTGLDLPWVPPAGVAIDVPPEGTPWFWGLAPIERSARLALNLFSGALALTPATDTTRPFRARIFAQRARLSTVITWVARTQDQILAEAESMYRDAPSGDEFSSLLNGEAGALLSPEARDQLVRLAYACKAYSNRTGDARAQLLEVSSALGMGGRAALKLLDAAADLDLAPKRRPNLERDLRCLLQRRRQGVFTSQRRRAELAQRLLELEVVQQAVAPNEDDPEQALTWLRLNAEAPCALDPRDRPEEKLTGLGLAHFAAFYKQSWRANDWMWGRLDGAARLVDLLVDPVQLRLALAASTTVEELASLIARIALGTNQTDAGYLSERARLRYGDERPVEIVRGELTALTSWDLEGEPTSRLERTRDLLRARIQLSVLRDELPVVRQSAIADAEDEGASPEAAGALWAKRQDALKSPEPPPQVLVGALRALRLAEDESIGDEAGASLLTRNIATSAVIAASALAAPRGGLPSVVRLVPRALRGLLLALYALTWSLTSRKFALRSVGVLVLVAALVILAWSLLGDVDAREATGSPEAAQSPPGWASALAKAVVAAALLVGVLRARMPGLIIVGGFLAAYGALVLTPWPDDILGAADRAWKTNATLSIVAALIALGLLIGFVGGSGPVESLWRRLNEPARSAARLAVRLAMVLASVTIVVAILLVLLVFHDADVWWLGPAAIVISGVALIIAFSRLRRARQLAAHLQSADIRRVVIVGGGRSVVRALRQLGGDHATFSRRQLEGLGELDVERDVEWLGAGGGPWRIVLVRASADLYNAYGNAADGDNRGELLRLASRPVRDRVFGTAGDAFRISRHLCNS